MPGALRRAGFVDDMDIARIGANQVCAKLPRIAKGGCAKDIGRICSIARADSVQPAKKPAKMAAKNAAVNMGLVNHNVGKAGQKRRPLLVMGQNGQIEHFGICYQCGWRIAPDFAAHVITGVAIVQGGCGARFLWPGCAKGVEGLQLVLGQGFEGKEIKRPGSGSSKCLSRTGKL